MRPRTVAAAIALSLSATMIAACSDDRPDRAVTIEQDETAPGQADEEADNGNGDLDTPGAAAGRRLTTAEATSALLTVSDLPSGWAASKDDEEEDGEDAIEPAKCQEVLDALDSDSTDAKVDVEADFEKGGPLGTLLSQSILSYEDEIDDEVVQKIADAFSDCPEFTSTDTAGERSKVSVSPMSFANLGDQTLAVTMTFESSMFTVIFNLAYIVTGHNALVLLNGGIAGADGGELETIAKKAVAKLERAAS